MNSDYRVRRPWRAIQCITGVLAAWAALGPAAMPAHAATPAEVSAAIEKAKAYLYTQQNNDTWEHKALKNEQNIGWDAQKGGWTALATYALLAADESPRDPRLAKTIEWLKKQDMEGIYALGIRAQIWQYLPQTEETARLAKRDGNLLMQGVVPDGAGQGFYHYTVKKQDRTDHSVSQYGVLGMWAAEQMNVEVKLGYWQAVDKAWRNGQLKDGGWGYFDLSQTVGPEDEEQAHSATASMTLAGVATLFIRQQYIRPADDRWCSGNKADPSIAHGIAWIAKEIPDAFAVHFRRTNWPHYTLYGLERVGVASGYKHFGGVNWFERGADYLVSTQNAQGAWGSVPDTAFALLFLVHGRAPVVMNKLEYALDLPKLSRDTETHWNQRPRDVANFCTWFGKKSERRLNWQIVNLKSAPVEELLDAPILFISGNQDLKFSAEDEQKLREFVERGGLILGNADCALPIFGATFKKLGARLFPKYEFRNLPPDHLFFNETFRGDTWKRKPVVSALSNGSRELMVLLPPGDAGRAWQMNLQAERELFELPANIAVYTSDRKNLRYKGDTYLVKADPAVKPAQRLKVARLEYSGNWDPEPAGWPRLAAILHNAGELEATPETVKLGTGKLAGYPVAHLTGTTRVVFTAEERAELRAFVQGGGILIVDAAGGAPAFAAAVETELVNIFGIEKYGRIRKDHEIFGSGTTKLEPEFRRYARKVRGGELPELGFKTVEMDGHTGLFFSPADLSTGLVGNAVDGVVGYEPAAAAELMSRLVQYAAAHGKAAGAEKGKE